MRVSCVFLLIMCRQCGAPSFVNVNRATLPTHYQQKNTEHRTDDDSERFGKLAFPNIHGSLRPGGSGFGCLGLPTLSTLVSLAVCVVDYLSAARLSAGLLLLSRAAARATLPTTRAAAAELSTSATQDQAPRSARRVQDGLATHRPPATPTRCRVRQGRAQQRLGWLQSRQSPLPHRRRPHRRSHRRTLLNQLLPLGLSSASAPQRALQQP